jgi:hypothetical protein
MSRRLAKQAGRLDAGSYPVRFAYRTLYSNMDANRHLNNGAFGCLFEEVSGVPNPTGGVSFARPLRPSARLTCWTKGWLEHWARKLFGASFRIIGR